MIGLLGNFCSVGFFAHIAFSVDLKCVKKARSAIKLLFFYFSKFTFNDINEPLRDKTNKVAYAPSEDRSAWASAQSDQCLRCPHEESLDP